MIERKDVINYRLINDKLVTAIAVNKEEKIIIKEVGNEWWNDYELWLLTNTPLPANPLPGIVVEDWVTLGRTLSESALFYKIYNASKLSTETNAIFTVLQNCITTTKNVITLKTILSELSKLAIVTTENKTYINKLLKDNKFNFTV